MPLNILNKIPYLIIISLILAFFFTSPAHAQKEEVIELLRADSSHWNLEEDNVIISLFGDVQFKHGNTYLNSDRAIWYKTAEQIVFLGRVKIKDEDVFLSAQRLTYYQRQKKIIAEHNVRLLSQKEQVLITGQRGEYQRERKYAMFTHSSKLEIYPEKPESTIVVTADTLEYFAKKNKGFAKGKVHIKKGDMDAYCGLAELSRGDSLHTEEDKVFLKQNPHATQKQNEISGDLMELWFEKRLIQKILVYGKAKATQKSEGLIEKDTLATRGESYVTGEKISFLLENENLNQVDVEGNATSLFIPSSEDTVRKSKNEASGDTISLYMQDNQVQRVLIKGGAMGTYYQTYPENPEDTTFVKDTIDYSAVKIDYLVDDSLIILEDNCNLKYQTISLDAGRIKFYTQKEVLTAQGLLKMDGEEEELYQIPVLRDKDEQITGKKMVYNLRTRRGRIDAGKTKFQRGLYYGESLRKVDQKTILSHKGTYTTCNQGEPHYNFSSSKMKIIPGDKVIAKPIILYMKDIPVAAIPFYVFPTKPGRHSGFLTFELGSFEANDRFIRNLGYYWAASEYWDMQGALDFYENSGWMVKGFFRYAKRYLFNGSFAGSYNRKSSWTGFTQSKSTRWDILFRHSHTISPSTKFSASGQFVSDKNYYKQFSFDFGYSTEKQSVRWYQSLYLNFGSSLLNYSYKRENDEVSKKKYTTFDNSVNLQFPQKIFSYLSLSPNLNYQETWYYVPETDMSREQDIKSKTFYRRGVPRLSLNANTKLYGTLYTSLGPVKGFRHVLTPTISFAWKPEVKKNDKLLFYTGKGGSGGKQRTLSFGLSNVFWMKTEKDQKEKKLQLFILNHSIGYNFVAKSRKLSNLRTSLRSSAIPNVNVDLTATHDFHDPKTGEIKKKLPRLLSFSANTNINISLRGFQSSSASSDTEEVTSQRAQTGAWGVRISHRYSETRTTGGVIKTQWASLSTGFWLTSSWYLSYVNRYDFEQKKITEQSFDLYRDLHCWEARFSWVLQGYRSGYYFKINIKALPEVKIEKSRGGLRDIFF